MPRQKKKRKYDDGRAWSAGHLGFSSTSYFYQVWFCFCFFFGGGLVTLASLSTPSLSRAAVVVRFFLVDSLFVSFSFPPASVSSSFVVPLIRADWRAIIKKLKQKQNRSVIFLQPNAPVQWPSFRKPWRISSIFMNYRRIMSNQSISNREIHYRNIMSKKNKESRRETQIEFDDQWKVAMIRPISVAI